MWTFMLNNFSETLTCLRPRVTSIVPAIWYTENFEALFLEKDVTDRPVMIGPGMAK